MEVNYKYLELFLEQGKRQKIKFIISKLGRMGQSSILQPAQQGT